MGISISDAKTRGIPNIYVNPAFCRMTGYAREELIGRNLRMLRGPETDEATLERFNHAVSAGEDCQVTLRVYRRNGTSFWNELLMSPVTDEAGEITNFVGIHTDVTERRKAAERIHELEIAKHIQLSLLPDAPLQLPCVELAGFCAPASQVGGDYFDYFENSGTVDMVIADVSGHSVGAALLMTEVRSTLRVEARKARAVSPAEVLRDLNELLYDDLTRSKSFITMLYMKYDPEGRRLTYANAGHNRAILLRAATVADVARRRRPGFGRAAWCRFEEKASSSLPGSARALYRRLHGSSERGGRILRRRTARGVAAPAQGTDLESVVKALLETLALLRRAPARRRHRHGRHESPLRAGRKWRRGRACPTSSMTIERRERALKLEPGSPLLAVAGSGNPHSIWKWWSHRPWPNYVQRQHVRPSNVLSYLRSRERRGLKWSPAREPWWIWRPGKP